MKGSKYVNISFATALKTGSAPLALALAGLVTVAAAPAYAQNADNTAAGAIPSSSSDANEEAREIIVTGSRISRPDLDAASPVSVVNQEQLRALRSSCATFRRRSPASAATPTTATSASPRSTCVTSAMSERWFLTMATASCRSTPMVSSILT